MISRRLLSSSSSLRAPVNPVQVCVIGAGPAGLYTAQSLLTRCARRSIPVKLDLLERLPVPFGLVRFGVAPDHPEVKNVESTFAKVMGKAEVGFYGNVKVGVDVKVDDLGDLYDVLIFAHGSPQDQKLGIPGEGHLGNVLAARSFVGFYNGLPDDAHLKVSTVEPA